MCDFPLIGFGTWQINDEEEMEQAILSALHTGYRLLDTASAYGNEEIIGKAISQSGVAREELFISGKVWNDDRGFDNTLYAFEKTLTNLKIDYLDSYLIHWPASIAVYGKKEAERINRETWRALERLHEEGRVRYVGVCNCLVHHLEELEVNGNVRPMINQIECHPGYMQKEVITYCQEKDIIVEGWSPLAHGKMMKKSVLKEIAEKYERTVAQICLRWCVQHGIVPIPKSSNPSRIIENYSIFDFSMDSEDMYLIDELPYLGGMAFNPDEITIFN